MTKIFNWIKSIKKGELNECVTTLKNGGIVIFPTDTVYGIGTNAFCKQSVKKIYQIKNRPNEKPLSILVSSKEEIDKYAIIENDIEKRIIEKFMPGAITIILKRKKGVLDYIAPGTDTIGIRIPDNDIILQILKNVNFPIVAPSANISGCPSGTQLSDILNDFKNKVNICIDGGKCKISQSSTIIQVVNNNVEILRQGIISQSDLNKVIDVRKN